MQVQATAILIKTEDFRVGYETGLAGAYAWMGPSDFS